MTRADRIFRHGSAAPSVIAETPPTSQIASLTPDTMKRPWLVPSLLLLAAGGLAAGPAPAASQGLWTSAAELRTLPAAGPAWDAVFASAHEDQGQPVVSNQNDPTNVRVLASAIVYARTGDAGCRDKAVRAIGILVQRGHPGGRTLAWARETGAYVLAADLIDYSSADFNVWLQDMAEGFRDDSGRTLLQMFRERPNNWGTHAFGSLVAIYAYLRHDSRLHEVRDYWIAGVTGPNPGYQYGDLSWQADPADPRIINPAGASKNGMNLDGVQPDDMRRGASFRQPPVFTNYVWEALQGHILGARVLERLGLPVWDVGDKALHRAFFCLQERYARLYGDTWKAKGDDEWMLPFIDAAYGTHWSSDQPHLWEAGKNAGYGYVVLADKPRPAGAPARASTSRPDRRAAEHPSAIAPDSPPASPRPPGRPPD